MQIEVPSDKYDAAIATMKERIRRGKVPGMVNSEEAASIVRRGHFTYEQVKNIAKAGKVESIVYDSAPVLKEMYACDKRRNMPGKLFFH